MAAAAVIALLACCQQSTAEDKQEIQGDLKIREGRIAVLSPSMPVTDATVLWEWDEEKLHGIPVEPKLHITGPAGEYKIVCRVITFDKNKRAFVQTIKGTLVIEKASAKSEKPSAKSEK